MIIEIEEKYQKQPLDWEILDRYRDFERYTEGDELLDLIGERGFETFKLTKDEFMFYLFLDLRYWMDGNWAKDRFRDVRDITDDEKGYESYTKLQKCFYKFADKDGKYNGFRFGEYLYELFVKEIKIEKKKAEQNSA